MSTSRAPSGDEVTAAIEEVAATIVLPRFRALADGEVSEKGPGDLVTVADVEAEQALTRWLTAAWPGSTVVGEEAVAADPRVLAAAPSHDRVWVVDPIDGTRNFVAGSPDFAVMVARVERGRTVESWIHHPAVGTTYRAERGAGAEVDGRPLRRTPAPEDVADLAGTVVTGLLDPPTARRVEARAGAVRELRPNAGAAGIQYPRVARGELDFVLWWRTHVWDHAPGALLLAEVGGCAVRLDGEDYEPWSDRRGLVVAADRGTGDRVRALLAPDGTL